MIYCLLSLVDSFIGLVAVFIFFLILYIYFPFSLFLSVYKYASLCDFVCIGLLLPFDLGFCLFIFFVVVLVSFLSSFSSEPCAWQGLCAPAGCRT